MGLEPGVSMAEVRSRWKVLARRFHPDHNPDDPLAESHFKDVQEAYRVLSDILQRSRYDKGVSDQLWSEVQPINNYFFARCEPRTVNCFEEINIIFTYSGRGRIFRKPLLTNFFVTGSPFVSQRMVIHEGQSIRETELTYIVCPLQPGKSEIGKATIVLDNTTFETVPVEINVLNNQCYFSKGNNADGKPFHLTMHFEYLPGEEPFRVSELKKNHVVLVPRSKTAFVFHQIGSVMKLVGTLYGMIKLNQEYDLNPLLGMAAGNLIAGINCYVLYAIAQVKPKYAAASIYEPVKNYIEKGYFLGESMGIPMVSGSIWYYLGRMFR